MKKRAPALPTRSSSRTTTVNAQPRAKTKLPAIDRCVSPVKQYYDASAVVDAPEYYDMARSLGTLTWDVWDHDVRPVGDRLREFVAAYPPEDPVRYITPGLQCDGRGTSWKLAKRADLLLRFSAEDGRTMSVHELLARYGLKLPGSRPIRVVIPRHDDLK
jgi:hypothetical protein